MIPVGIKVGVRRRMMSVRSGQSDMDLQVDFVQLTDQEAIAVLQTMPPQALMNLVLRMRKLLDGASMPNSMVGGSDIFDAGIAGS